MSVKALVFDLDGTLVDSTYQHLARRLADLRVGMAIATSATRNEAQDFLDRLRLDDSVAIITSDEIDTSKPSGAQFEAAFKKLGVKSHEAAIVGDSTWDMLASRQSGSFGVGVLTGGYSREELAASGALRVVRDVEELLDRLPELGITSRQPN